MREEIIKTTLSSLDHELDALREALFESLEHYEGQLRARCKRLPQWLALGFHEVWPLFCFSPSSVSPQAALGPRVVAVAAGELDAFIEQWLGRPGAIKQHTFAQSPSQLSAYLRADDALERALRDMLIESERVARHARETLAQWRDDILSELEDSRVRDIEAIELLVAEGTLGTTRDAKKEIAFLWEEQRRLASSLLRAWEPFESLVSQGLEFTADGIEELQSLHERARQAMIQAYPSIQRQRSPESIIPTSVREDPFKLAASSSKETSTTTHEDLILLDSRATAGEDFDPYGADSDVDEPLPFAFDDRFDDTPLATEPPPPFEFEDEEDEEELPAVSSTQPLAASAPMLSFDDEEPAPTAPPGRAPAPRSTRPPARAPERASARVPSSPSEDLFMLPGEHFGREDELDLSAPKRAATLPWEASATDPIPFLLDETSSPEQEPQAPPRRQGDAGARSPRTADVATPPRRATSLPPPQDAGDVHVQSAQEQDVQEQDVQVQDAEVETLLTITRDELRSAALAEDSEPLDEPGDEPGDEPQRASSARAPEARTRRRAQRPARAVQPEDQGEDQGEDRDEDRDEAAGAGREAMTARRPRWAAPPLETTGQRLQEQRSLLHPGVFLAAFGLPMALVLGTLALSAAAHQDPTLPNPLSPAPTMAHFIGAALLLWLAACPWVLRWQITWRGWRPTLWQERRVHEEADLVLDATRIELGPWELPWEQLEEIALERWEDHDLGLRGWTLTLLHQGQLHRLSAQALDEAIWAQAAEPLAQPHPDAWRMPARHLNQIVEAALDRTLGEDEPAPALTLHDDEE